MTETEKLKSRIQALGYSVEIIATTATYGGIVAELGVVDLLRSTEVLIINQLTNTEWDKSNKGFARTIISYLHWWDGKPISFSKVRKDIDGEFNGFEDCIKRYSFPPRPKIIYGKQNEQKAEGNSQQCTGSGSSNQ